MEVAAPTVPLGWGLQYTGWQPLFHDPWWQSMTKIRLIAAVLGAAFLFGAGWVTQGWRLSAQHSQEIAKRDLAALEVAEAVKQAGIVANTAISDADQRAWKGLKDDKKELDRLRGCVADRTCGVRLITKYVRDGRSDSGSSSVGNDSVELDADVQQRVLDHKQSISEDQRKIEYLQEYAQVCWRGIN